MGMSISRNSPANGTAGSARCSVSGSSALPGPPPSTITACVCGCVLCSMSRLNAWQLSFKLAKQQSPSLAPQGSSKVDLQQHSTPHTHSGTFPAIFHT